MSNVRTLNSINNRSSQEDWKNSIGHKLQKENLTDESDCGPSTGNKPRRISINISTVLPHKLSNNDVCSLYGKFLQDLEDDEYESCIEKLRREKITGRTLVQASENAKVMEELTKTLCFPFDLKLRFDDMIKQIKKRVSELKEGNNESENVSQTFPIDIDNANTPMEHGQTISNAGCVIGGMYNHGQNQSIHTACTYYGKPIKKSP